MTAHIYSRKASGWTAGTVKDGEKVTARFELKVFETGSEHGIDGGKISKLYVTRAGAVIASYDRGWDIAPTGDGARIVEAIIKEYN